MIDLWTWECLFSCIECKRIAWTTWFTGRIRWWHNDLCFCSFKDSWQSFHVKYHMGTSLCTFLLIPSSGLVYMSLYRQRFQYIVHSLPHYSYQQLCQLYKGKKIWPFQIMRPYKPPLNSSLQMSRCIPLTKRSKQSFRSHFLWTTKGKVWFPCLTTFIWSTKQIIVSLSLLKNDLISHDSLVLLFRSHVLSDPSQINQ